MIFNRRIFIIQSTATTTISQSLYFLSIMYFLPPSWLERNIVKLCYISKRIIEMEINDQGKRKGKAGEKPYLKVS